ncbi:hypothetical protein BaRGS_00018007, partial [Batillaria attramentaria]
RVESDHMPVVLEFRSTTVADQPSRRVHIEKRKWNPAYAGSFCEAVRSANFRDGMRAAIDCLSVCVETALQTFTDFLLSAGDCMVRKVCYGGPARAVGHSWFDDECRQKKREARKALRRYMRTGLTVDKDVYRQKRSQYKDTLTNKKKTHKQKVLDDLMANKNDSKAFWACIKKANTQHKQLPDINMDTWKQHFETLLSEDDLVSEHGHITDLNDDTVVM